MDLKIFYKSLVPFFTVYKSFIEIIFMHNFRHISIWYIYRLWHRNVGMRPKVGVKTTNGQHIGTRSTYWRVSESRLPNSFKFLHVPCLIHEFFIIGNDHKRFYRSHRSYLISTFSKYTSVPAPSCLHPGTPDNVPDIRFRYPENSLYPSVDSKTSLLSIWDWR